MDVMVCQVSRSGNYQLQAGYMQAIFPDRECFMWFSHELTTTFPIGKYWRVSFPNQNPFTPNHVCSRIRMIVWNVQDESQCLLLKLFVRRVRSNSTRDYGVESAGRPLSVTVQFLLQPHFYQRLGNEAFGRAPSGLNAMGRKSENRRAGSGEKRWVKCAKS